MSPPAPLSPSDERSLILLVALVQFVNVLDFMIVMPLGPDFARALDIPASQIGLIGGSYTFAAAFTGLACGPFLDQFSRKRALLVCLGGLILATLAGAFVWDMHSMLAARIVAGMFGGQMFALSQALIADFIPAQRRGTAMGKVAGGFAAASVIGVPFGLELASRLSWHAPFIATALIGAAIWLLALARLPYHAPFATQRNAQARIRHLFGLLGSRLTVASYAVMGFSMMAGFMIIPNIAAHLQMNLGYPRASLGLLYLIGGTVSFFGMRFAGRMMDKRSATQTVTLFTAVLVLGIGSGFLFPSALLPVVVIFTCFMAGMSGRNVCAGALSSKVPPPQDRGAYMSLQASVTHFSSALGSTYASAVLTEQDGKLLNVPVVAVTAIALSLLVPPLVYYIEHHLRKRPTVPPVPVAVEESIP